MEKIKMLIADENAMTRKALASAIAQEPDMELVSATGNGAQLLEQLKTTQVDVLVMDMLITQVDGFGILEALNAMPQPRPRVVVASALGSDEVVSRAMEMGVSYYVLKPCDAALLLRRIRELTKPASASPIEPVLTHGKSIDERIAAIFLTIGIPAHIKGYQFLREAVKQVVAKPEIINRITKELYPAIAERFETTPSKVERAIRHAIEVAWNRGRIEMINQLFGHCVYTQNDKPTNGEFIALIADKISCEEKSAS